MENDPVIEEYSRLALRYDRRWSFYVAASTRETLARFTVGAGERVLDVGCGTGAMLERLSAREPAARLCGIDPVAEMLAVARRRLGERAELKSGWAEAIPYPDESFDAVISCNMFHYIRRPAEALAEMRRVLRPGGRLVITDWCDDYLACRLCDRYLRLFNRAHQRVYREEECRRMLGEAGYERMRLDRYKISWLWGLMTVTGAKPAAEAQA